MSLVKIILVGLIAINSATSAEQQAWKDIRYMARGWSNFRSRINWIAQYDEWDRGTYFEDSDDSGILRIDVSTLNSKALLDQNSTVDLLIALDEDSTGEFSALPNGNALHSYTQQVAEGRIRITHLLVGSGQGHRPPPPAARELLLHHPGQHAGGIWNKGRFERSAGQIESKPNW